MMFDKEVERQKIKEHFPHLNILFTGDVVGRIKFQTKYINGNWEPCSDNNDLQCVKGDYHIQFNFANEVVPKVFETQGKLKRLANKLNNNIRDLHINTDGSCCLDYYIKESLTLYEFIKNKVYPYFAWQAYYEKFQKSPPSGEYSHGNQARIEFQKDFQNLSRNDTCLCGSGKNISIVV